MERLQRFLAEAGVASRRHAEELIEQGRVAVDGKVVTDLGLRIDPERQRVEVDGQVVRPQRKRYIMLNKPPGYITTAQDERGRRTVLDLVQVPERVVPVGRLDRQTSGLLLLTNDGDLAYRIAHPKFELDKEYHALLDGHPPPEVLQRLRQGVVIDGERVRTEQVKPLRNEEAGTLLSIVIQEGRNRIVRRMLDRVGYPAISLERVRIGPISVRGVPAGHWRDLTAGEIEQLFEAVGMIGEEPEAPSRPRPAPERPAGERRASFERGGPSRGATRTGGRPGTGPPSGRRAAAGAGSTETARTSEQRRQGGRPGQRQGGPGRVGGGRTDGAGEYRRSGQGAGRGGEGGAPSGERRGPRRPAPAGERRDGGAVVEGGGSETTERRGPTRGPRRVGAPPAGSRPYRRGPNRGPRGERAGQSTGRGGTGGSGGPARGPRGEREGQGGPGGLTERGKGGGVGRPSRGGPAGGRGTGSRGPGQTGGRYKRGDGQQGGSRPPGQRDRKQQGKRGPGNDRRRSGGGGQEHGREPGRPTD